MWWGDTSLKEILAAIFMKISEFSEMVLPARKVGEKSVKRYVLDQSV